MARQQDPRETPGTDARRVRDPMAEPTGVEQTNKAKAKDPKQIFTDWAMI